MHWDATTLRLPGAEWGRVGRVGLGGVGEGLGMHWDAIKQLGAEWGRVGPSRALPAHLNSERVHKQPRC